jgi:chemotaxis protein CheD
MSARDARATRHYFDSTFNYQAVKVLPNEYYVTGDDVMITTVLGSCVAACIRDPQTGVGGMNHFMLPEGDSQSPASATMRYGAFAMEVLINEVLKAGASRERLQAKVFGGGAVLAAMHQMNIGERNAQFVLNYLKMENIPVAARDLGDVYARRISFFPARRPRHDAQDDLQGARRGNHREARSGCCGDAEGKDGGQADGGTVRDAGAAGCGDLKVKGALSPLADDPLRYLIPKWHDRAGGQCSNPKTCASRHGPEEFSNMVTALHWHEIGG